MPTAIPHSNTSGRRGPAHRRHRALQISALIFVTLLVVTLLGRCLYHFSAAGQHAAYQISEFNQQVGKLQTGESHAIFLYDTSATNSLLHTIREMSAIEELNLDLTDASDAGMRDVGTLRNLRELTFHGGPQPIGDSGLSQLRNCSNLETLNLINSKVTDQGLIALKELPKLSSLKLHRDAFRERTLSDAGLSNLKHLTHLRSLALTGGWVTDDSIHRLNGMTTLQSLQLEGPNITDAGILKLKHLTTLEFLDVRRTKVTDTGIAELMKRLPALKVNR